MDGSPQMASRQQLDTGRARQGDWWADGAQAARGGIDLKHGDVVARHVGTQRQFAARRDRQVLRPLAETRFNPDQRQPAVAEINTSGSSACVVGAAAVNIALTTMGNRDRIGSEFIGYSRQKEAVEAHASPCIADDYGGPPILPAGRSVPS